ncbi:diaminobutyrate aminotransferase [Roseiarcus fermentans]|uniref:Diaminobutyrate--2-oxoglutarate transaminase n=1 Tax=Roseiarcus fermentans TaxID=1473586 RepID=A0A366EXM6_9HYPH|nr:diaminobutyrate--2-oxoglutarate transaminase [Roseiarcus fermentans]RBP07104.1 diaminobutyrate aminotransferase [Roseiarcus fermentans]
MKDKIIRIRPTELTDGLESEVRWYSRRMSAVLSRAKGAKVWDAAGAEYIDFLTGCGALNYGHNPDPLKRALLDYIEMDGIVSTLDLRTKARAEFMIGFEETILRPRKLQYKMMFPGPTGTNAVEAALKLARKVTRRTNVVAFTNAFHGVTLGSLAVTANRAKRAGAGVPLGQTTWLPYDGYFGPSVDTADLIAQMVQDPGSGIDPPAAFLLETVQGEGGGLCASAGWLRRLCKLARDIGSLVIIDDIQAGCGRTGTFFSFEDIGVEPDLVCLSKSLSGYGLALSMVLMRPEHDVWAPGEHNGTFRGQNHAFVTARAALAYWRDETFLRRLADAIETLDAWIARLVASDPSRWSARGRGLLRGVACGDGEFAARVCHEAYQAGVLVETSGAKGDVVKFLPPLNVSAEDMDDALGRLDGAFALVANDYGRGAELASGD